MAAKDNIAGMTWPQEWPGQVPSRGSVGQRSARREFGEREWNRLIQDALGEVNEIRFRQRISEHLSNFGMSKRAQRTKLRDAVRVFREYRRGNQVVVQETGMRAPHTEAPKSRAKRYQIQSVDKLLRSGAKDEDTEDEDPIAAEIRERVEHVEPVGLHPHKLHDLINAHGSAKVRDAIRAARVKLSHGVLRVHRAKRATGPGDIGPGIDLSAIAKGDGPEGPEPSAPEQLPVGANSTKLPGTHNVTQGVSDAALPVGARKIWNRRVVEKKPDMKWHVVGHVAGLETPARVPQLADGAIDRETLLHLLQQLIRIRHAQRTEDTSDTEGGKNPLT